MSAGRAASLLCPLDAEPQFLRTGGVGELPAGTWGQRGQTAAEDGSRVTYDEVEGRR